jgi:hypothetical protein
MSKSVRFAVAAGMLTLTSAVLAAAPGGVREPALAGGWYPESRAELALETHRLLRAAAGAPTLPGRPVALVVPHAGWRYSGLAAAAAFRTVKPGDFNRVVVVAPSHHAGFSGFSVDNATFYRTPLADTPVCTTVVQSLRGGSLVRTVAGASDPEHAVEIELPFLQEQLAGFCLVPILAGQTTPEQEMAFAERLAKLDDGKTLFVFSSDFTHYGPRFDYTPFGPSAPAARDKIFAQDLRAADLLARKDAAGFRAFLGETGATICGRAGLGVMGELLARIAPKASATRLAQYMSIDLPRERDDNSVTYVAMAFTREPSTGGTPISGAPKYEPVSPGAPPLPAATGKLLVRLARAALATELAGGDDLRHELAALPAGPEMERLQGVFVTLNRKRPEDIAASGKLRGCVGQIFPVYPLYAAIVNAAVDAALHDGRFIPVHTVELPNLALEVTVLSPPKPVASWRDIKLGVHGIVIEKDGRKAVFLPQVPEEQGWNIEQTLAALAQKAGLAPDAWREGAQFSVFTGQIFHE